MKYKCFVFFCWWCGCFVVLFVWMTVCSESLGVSCFSSSLSRDCLSYGRQRKSGLKLNRVVVSTHELAYVHTKYVHCWVRQTDERKDPQNHHRHRHQQKRQHIVFYWVIVPVCTTGWYFFHPLHTSKENNKHVGGVVFIVFSSISSKEK